MVKIDEKKDKYYVFSSGTSLKHLNCVLTRVLLIWPFYGRSPIWSTYVSRSSNWPLLTLPLPFATLFQHITSNIFCLSTTFNRDYIHHTSSFLRPKCDREYRHLSGTNLKIIAIKTILLQSKNESTIRGALGTLIFRLNLIFDIDTNYYYVDKHVTLKIFHLDTFKYFTDQRFFLLLHAILYVNTVNK